MAASGESPLVEVAVDSAEAAAMAWTAGADRLELCQALEVGGLTPSAGLIETVVAAAAGPVFVMIRPRPGGFELGAGDLEAMAADIRHARRCGAAGIVTGALTSNLDIDSSSMARLREAAEGLPITFHRAFDLLSSPAAMGDLAELGVSRVLTAGGAATAFEGRERIGFLRRIGSPAVVAGGGVTSDTVVALVESTGVSEIHLSGVRAGGRDRTGFGRDTEPNPERVARVVAALAAAFPRPTT